MEKYSLLRARVTGFAAVDLDVPEAATSKQLRRVHSEPYVEGVLAGSLSKREVRRIGFPWSPELVERSLRSVGGTIAAGRSALKDGTAANLAGGTHHAFPGHGEGFCVFNDVAVAIRALEADGVAHRFSVLDLDVHQGNGTAAIFEDDDAVFTLSVHGENNFPFTKETSDLDLQLPDGTGDDAFLTTVEHGVRTALSQGADLAFFVAGADPYEGDRLGRLSVTKHGMAERDRLVFDLCERAGAPVAVVMAGGYAHTIADTVDIHEATIRGAAARTRAHVDA